MNPEATVGIVLVSHSAALAEGAAELASQVAGGTVAVIPAGGTDDGGLGTSAAKVQQAVKRAGRGAGVLIIPDLGSAVLTVRSLLAGADDLAGPDDQAGPGDLAGADDLAGSGWAGRIELADAPFVEGVVAATVTAAGGADIEAVRGAAEEAWHARKL